MPPSCLATLQPKEPQPLFSRGEPTNNPLDGSLMAVITVLESTLGMEPKPEAEAKAHCEMGFATHPSKTPRAPTSTQHPTQAYLVHPSPNLKPEFRKTGSFPLTHGDCYDDL